MSKKSSSLHRAQSAILVDPVERAPSRAMLYAVGFKEVDFKKNQIGIASTWSMVTPCNMHIDKLAQESETGVNAAGGKGVIFNTSPSPTGSPWARRG
jgi:dihydroxy-acid dehydratase